MSVALRRVRTSTLLVLLAVPAGSALAQQGPQPAPAPTPLPVPGVLQRPARQLPGFTVAANVGGGWDSNPAWQADPNASIAGYGSASLGKTWSSPLFSLTAAGRGNASIFESGVAANRYDYGGSLSAAGQIGARTNLALSLDGAVQHNDQLFDPLTSGLLLPVVRTEAYSASADLSRQVGTRSEIGIGGGWSRLMFDSPTLQDGTAVYATARANRAVSARGRLTANYNYQTNDYETSGRTHIHTLAAGYDAALGARSRLSFAAGSDARRRGTSPTTWSLYLNSTYSWTGQRTAFVASYRRGVNPGPGLGEDRLLGAFSAGFSAALSRRISLSLSGLHGNNTRGDGSDARYAIDEVSASLRGRLSRDLGLAVQQEYRRQGEVENIQALADFRISLRLDYAKAFR